MAHGLSNIRLHQALHGYVDGHRLLASSTAVKPKDLRTMLVMSDASGPGAVIGEKGYLTGYPLTDSGLYAFASTWAATEMARPGCVWTHTLLIDFSDLAVLSSLAALLNLFRRPSDRADVNSYKIQLTLVRDVPLLPSSPSSENEDVLRRLLLALYEHPKSKIIASGDDCASRFAMSIWAQQWPRLRRAFRFCTLAFGDRSSEGSPFDLQFVPKHERSIRLRFPDSIDAERLNPSNSTWIDDVILDISGSGDVSLRRFLREVGGDVSTGREAFMPLCQLHHLLARIPHEPEVINRAIELLDSAFDKANATSLRTMVVVTAARHLERLGDGSAIDFLLEHLDYLDSDGIKMAAERVGRLLWTRDPKVLTDLLTQAPPRPFIAERALATLSPADLVDGLRRQPAPIPIVVERRPEILAHSGLWEIRGTWLKEGLRIASREFKNVETVLPAIFAARRSDISTDVAEEFGSLRVLRALSSANFGALSATELTTWLAVAGQNAQTIAEFLSTLHRVGTKFLAAIARRTYPDFVPNEYGDDPWWTALRQSITDADENDKQYIAAYLLARGLGYRSRNQPELIEYSFDDVYFPALSSKLTLDAWGVVSPKLPDSWFLEWDKCRRLRDAVVDTFVTRDLPPLGFLRMTRDDVVFEQLAILASRNGRGRRYLKRVLESLKQDSPVSHRLRLIERLL